MKIKNGIQISKRSQNVFWGIVLILTAVVLILDGIGYELGYGIKPWRIILGVVLTAWLISNIVKRHFADIFFPLAFMFIVFEKPIAHAIGRADNDLNLISNWVVLLAALLLTIGFGKIFKKSSIVSINGEPTKIGSSTLYFDASNLSNASVQDNLGSVQVYITNRDAYVGGGIIKISDNLGKVTVHLPKDWDVVTQVSDNLGKVHVPEKDISGGKSITLYVTDNLGNVSVVFD